MPTLIITLYTCIALTVDERKKKQSLTMTDQQRDRQTQDRQANSD